MALWEGPHQLTQESRKVGLEVTVLGGVVCQFVEGHLSRFPATVKRVVKQPSARKGGCNHGVDIWSAHDRHLRSANALCAETGLTETSEGAGRIGRTCRLLLAWAPRRRSSTLGQRQGASGGGALAGRSTVTQAAQLNCPAPAHEMPGAADRHR